MKKIIPLICILLCFIFSISAFTGCDNKNSSGASNGSETNSVFKDGVHKYDYKETEKDFVKNSTTEYKIIIPQTAGKTLQTAVSDMQMLFEEATGISLNVFYDTQTDVYADGKFISLGQTSCMQSEGVSIEGKKLDRHGYIIKTVGDAIYICGGDEYGTSFGIYGFLELEFNFDCFSNTCYHIDRGVTNKKLREYDVIDIPDMKIRNSGDGFILNNNQTERWMRYIKRDSGGTFCGSASAHTAESYYLKQSVYGYEYPEWYAVNPNGTAQISSRGIRQLCYTAQGNAEKLAKMQEEAFNLLKEQAIKDTTGYLFVFSQEDSELWCECATCKASLQEHQSNAAVVIDFLNNVADRLSVWMESEEGKPYARDYKILFLAYEATLTAPKGVTLNDHLSVMFAPIAFDYQNSLYHKQNEKFLQAFEGWKKICKQFSIYSYHVNYINFMLPYDSFNSMQGFYQYAASANTYWFFDLGQRSQTAGASGWETLKAYISSKLSWNVNRNVSELTDKFFKYSYGAAADTMRAFYEEYRVHSRYIIDKYLTKNLSVYGTPERAEYWPKKQLDVWVNKTETALQEIEFLKTSDLQSYNQISNRIKLERIWLYYAMCSMHHTAYDIDYISAVKEEFKNDCLNLGVSYTQEGSSELISKLLESWTWGN